MATISVRPRTDGHNVRGSWKVEKNNSMVSPHLSKEAAKNKARRVANEGDTLVIHRTDGTIQKRVTVRNTGSTDDDEFGGFSFPSGGDYGTGVLEEQDGFFE